jgi:hypothetical protein
MFKEEPITLEFQDITSFYEAFYEKLPVGRLLGLLTE